MSYSQKFYITNPARFGRFVGKKWTNVNKIVQPLGVRADKGEDSRGVHIKLSANHRSLSASRHQVHTALRLLEERQSATSRKTTKPSSAGPARPPAPASYSRKFYVETHVLQPEVDFARFVGKRWNNINKILKQPSCGGFTVRSRDHPTKTIKKSLVRADKGEDELGLYVVLSAPRTHSKKVDLALLLLQQRQQKCNGTQAQQNSYRPAAPRPTSQCKGPIVVQRQRPAPSQPRHTSCDRPMTPQQSSKPAMAMPPPPPPEAIAAGLAVGKELREKASFDVTRCADPARSEQPTRPAPQHPQQDATWQNWIKGRSSPKTEEFSLFSAPMPRYGRKSVVTVADVARGLQDLPATTGYKTAPGSTAASVTGEPSYPASVASDYDAPTEQYPALPAVPALKFCPTKCMARLNKLHVSNRVVQKRRRTQTDQRNCKGSFNVGALEMGNKALERHLDRISKSHLVRIDWQFGPSPGFYITGRRTSRTVHWTVRGSHLHNAFGQMLQEWYTGITAPHQAPTSDGTSTAASTVSSVGPMSLEEYDALPTTQEPARQPTKAPFFSKHEKAALDMKHKQTLREESLAGAIPSLCRRESYPDQAWSPTRTEPW